MSSNTSNHKNYFLLERGRLESFRSWPFGPKDTCNVANMAEAGFYWSGTQDENDSATCFVCTKSLDGWEANDDPWAEHKKHAPQCPFVKIGKSEKDMTVGEFLELVEKVTVNILQKQHRKIRSKALEKADRKREELRQNFDT